MPYIKADDGRREALRKGEPALSAGELNYQCFYFIKHSEFVQTLVDKNLRDSEIFDEQFNRLKVFVDNFLGKKPNYQKYNDMSGALLRCYREVQRRLNKNAVTLIYLLDSYDDEIAKYEDLKIGENGDVE